MIADQARHTEDAAQFADQARALGGPDISAEAEQAAGYFLAHPYARTSTISPPNGKKGTGEEPQGSSPAV